jgi:hypothetical protein
MRIQFFIYNHNIIWFRLLNYHDVTLGVGQVEPVLIYCFVENRSYLGQIVLSRVETHTLPLILLPGMFVFFFIPRRFCGAFLWARSFLCFCCRFISEFFGYVQVRNSQHLRRGS